MWWLVLTVWQEQGVKIDTFSISFVKFGLLQSTIANLFMYYLWLKYLLIVIFECCAKFKAWQNLMNWFELFFQLIAFIIIDFYINDLYISYSESHIFVFISVSDQTCLFGKFPSIIIKFPHCSNPSPSQNLDCTFKLWWQINALFFPICGGCTIHFSWDFFD